LKISEEAGLQILGPDDDAIRKVRIISSTFAGAFLFVAFVGLETRPSKGVFQHHLKEAAISVLAMLVLAFLGDVTQIWHLRSTGNMFHDLVNG
jgi:hypothetical protein